MKDDCKRFTPFSFSLLVLAMFLFAAAIALSGCGGGGGGGSSSSTAPTNTATTAQTTTANTTTAYIQGQVLGGDTPLANVTVYLYAMGDTNYISSDNTDNNGNYSFEYMYQSNENPVLYVVSSINNSQYLTATAGYAQKQTRSVETNIDGLTAAESAYAVNSVGGSINSNGSINASDSATLLNNYDNIQNDPSSVPNHPDEIYNVANVLASCINHAYRARLACFQVNLAMDYTLGNPQFAINMVQNYSKYQIPIISASYQMEGETPWSIVPDTSFLSNQLPLYYTLSLNKIYINAQINGSSPLGFTFDTAANGIAINRSALQNAGISIGPTRYNFTSGFGNPVYVIFGGYVALANITLPDGFTVNNFPIAVIDTCAPVNPNDTTLCNSSGTGFNFPGQNIVGDMGMGLSPYAGFGNYEDGVFTPSILAALPDNMDNGFILNFDQDSNLINEGYDYITQGQQAGYVTLGLNTEIDNSFSSDVFYPNSYPAKSGVYDYPIVNAEFGGYTTDSTDNSFSAVFDTGTPYIGIYSDALADAIGHAWSEYQYLGGLNILYGKQDISSYGFKASNGLYYPLNSVTISSPYVLDSVTGQYDIKSINLPTSEGVIIENLFVDLGPAPTFGNELESIGLPIMFNHTMFWASAFSAYGWGVGAIN